MDEFHHNFKLKVGFPITTFCFPVLPHKQTSEFASREEICSTVLAQKFSRNVANMMWFEFDRVDDTIDPDIPLPLGNFVISAQSGIGKTNAALAILYGFARWRRKPDEDWKESPDYDWFDVIYINLKPENGSRVENDNASVTNEVQLLKAFLRKKTSKLNACDRSTSRSTWRHTWQSTVRTRASSSTPNPTGTRNGKI